MDHEANLFWCELLLRVSLFSPLMVIYYALVSLPFAMIATFITAKSKGRDAWFLTANGSMLFMAFVLPWIGMMLNLLGRRPWRRLWRWVWCLGYVYVFTSAFAMAVLLCILWSFLGSSPWDEISEVPLLVVMLVVVEGIALSIVLISSLSRLRRRRDPGSERRYEWSNVQDGKAVGTEDARPFVLIAIWYLQAWVAFILMNVIGADTSRALEFVFDFNWDPAGMVLPIGSTLVFPVGNVVLGVWLMFLAGYWSFRLVRRLAYRSKKGSSNDG